MIKHNHGYVENALSKRFYTALYGEVLLIVKIDYTDEMCNDVNSFSVFTCKGIDNDSKSKIIKEYIYIDDFRELNKFMRLFNTNCVEKTAVKYLNRFKSFNIITNKINNRLMYFCMLCTNDTFFENCLFSFNDKFHIGHPVVKERGFTKLEKAYDFLIKSFPNIRQSFLINYYSNMYQRSVDFKRTIYQRSLNF